MIVKLGSSALIETSEAIKNANIPVDVKKQLESKDPDFVYFVARAITADIPNGNGDLFPWEELQKSYRSFVGQHIDYNHLLDHSNIIGKMIDSWLDDKEKCIMILGKVDRIGFPDIARQIEKKILDHVSMEAMVGASECSICGHTIKNNTDKKCDHLERSLLKECEYRGETKKCFAINRLITFTGLGVVLSPADRSAEISTVIAKMTKYASEFQDVNKEFIQQQMDELSGKESPQDSKGGGGVVAESRIPEKDSKAVLNDVLHKINAAEFLSLKDEIERRQEASIAKKSEAAPAVAPEKKEEVKTEIIKEVPKVDASVKVAEVVPEVTPAVAPAAPAAAPVAVPVVEEKKEDVVEVEPVTKAELKDSFWLFRVNGEPVLYATLGNIWQHKLAENAEVLDADGVALLDDKGQPVKLAEYALSDTYKKLLEASIKEQGLDKVAKLISANVYPSTRSIGKGQYEIDLGNVPKTKTPDGIDLKDNGSHDKAPKGQSGDEYPAARSIKTSPKVTKVKADEAPAGVVKTAEEGDHANAPKLPMDKLPKDPSIPVGPEPIADLPRLPEAGKDKDKKDEKLPDFPTLPGEKSKKKEMSPKEAVKSIYDALESLEKVADPKQVRVLDKIETMLDEVADIVLGKKPEKAKAPKKEEKEEKKPEGPKGKKEEKGEEKKDEKKEEKKDGPKEEGKEPEELMKSIMTSLKSAGAEIKAEQEGAVLEGLVGVADDFADYCEYCDSADFAKLTPDAQEFISKEIEKNISEHKMPQDQAEAAAYTAAREKGMNVPEKKASLNKEAKKDKFKKIMDDWAAMDSEKPSEDYRSWVTYKATGEWPGDAQAMAPVPDVKTIGPAVMASETKAEKAAEKSEEKREEKAEEKAKEKAEEKKEEKAEKKASENVIEPVKAVAPAAPVKTESELALEKQLADVKASLETKEAELKVKNSALVEKEAQLKAKGIERALEKKNSYIAHIVRAMFERDMIKYEQVDVEAGLKDGLKTLEAQGFAVKQAIARQQGDMMKMDNISLKAFGDSILKIQKKADSTGSTLLKEAFSPSVGEDSYEDDDTKFFKILAPRWK